MNSQKHPAALHNEKTQVAFDVIILGGGIIGLTLANFCTHHGLTTAVVEKNKQTFLDLKNNSINTEDTFDSRCVAITKTTENILKEINVWDDIIAKRVSPYKNMRVWDAAGFGQLHIFAEELGRDYLGHIVEHKIILESLYHKICADKAIKFFCPFYPHALSYEDNKIILRSEEHSMSASLIIGADGAHSWLREEAKMDYLTADYDQAALVATVKTELAHDQTAWQRFLPDGPLAFLPLAECYTSSIVWTSTEANIQQYLTLPENDFCKTLAHAFDYRLGKVHNVIERMSFPLKKLQAKQYTQNRIALVGDAAHVIHPLAGLGLNLGFLDVKALADLLLYAKENQFDLGHTVLLKKYEKARKYHNRQVGKVMDLLNQCYKMQNTIVLGLRGLGMSAIDKSHYLKKKILSFVD